MKRKKRVNRGEGKGEMNRDGHRGRRSSMNRYDLQVWVAPCRSCLRVAPLFLLTAFDYNWEWIPRTQFIPINQKFKNWLQTHAIASFLRLEVFLPQDQKKKQVFLPVNLISTLFFWSLHIVFLILTPFFLLLFFLGFDDIIPLGWKKKQKKLVMPFFMVFVFNFVII